MFKNAIVAGLISLVAWGAQAQASRAADALAKEDARQAINLDLREIDTREDLVRHLGNSDPTNPLMKLSPAARQRMLDTLIVNGEGHISSLWIDDIETELSPSEAYRVLALFGHAELAARVNNGRIDSDTDRKVLALWGSTDSKLVIARAYCNAGYCTDGTQQYCDTTYCHP